jgi:hypothetical protein
MRASGGRDCNDDGKVGDGGTSSSKGRSRSNSGDGCSACSGSKLEAIRASNTDSSISADGDRDNELKLTREIAREQAVQWAAAYP